MRWTWWRHNVEWDERNCGPKTDISGRQMGEERQWHQKRDSAGKWSCLYSVLLPLATVLLCTDHIQLTPSMPYDQGSSGVWGCRSHFHRETHLPGKHGGLWHINRCLIRSLPLIHMNIYHCWVNTHLLSFHLDHPESPPALLLISSNEYVTGASVLPTKWQHSR